MTDQEKAVFAKLSYLLETVVDTLIENQRFLVASHKALKDLNPGYADSFARYLAASRSPDKQNQQEKMSSMWETSAKSDLLALRHL
ncbi:MAG: hypothetical protein ABSF23_11255 [Terracidiphilus sp.]|jgi:hypothetical protein